MADEMDEELLIAWRAGDVRAGGELFKRYFDPLYAFFRNKSAGNTDELVQRTFLACVEGRDRIRDGGLFRGYMMGAARRVLYRWYSEQRVGGARFDPAVSSLFDARPSPSQVVVEKIEHRVVLEGLRRVTLDQQVALELYYLQGIRAPDLVEILEVPEPAIRGRLRRGLENLRQQVASLGGSPAILDQPLEELEARLTELGVLVRTHDGSRTGADSSRTNGGGEGSP